MKIMKKQEKIKEAYGEYWESVKYSVDENGWCNIRRRVNFEEITNKLGWEAKLGDQYIWRPKSLKGIENNNGWIKIESEIDLPTKQKMCFCYNELGHVFTTTLYKSKTNYSYVKRENITHYQPIIKPQPPIY